MRIAVTYALTTPLAAAVLAITIVVGLLTTRWFFLLGFAFYAFLVWSTLRDEDQIRRVIVDELYPERSSDLRKLRGRYATIMQEALDDRKRIERALNDSPAPIQRALSDTMEQVGAITDTIYEISYKAQSLEESLSEVNADREQQEVNRLQRAIKSTQDEYLRRQYQETLDTKQEQLDNLSKVRNALDRWHAQLQRAATTLDNLYSQVLMIRSAEIRNLTEASDVVTTSLRDQVEELRLTSQAMDEVFSQT
jgi:chromosome segregation ATPase